MTHPCALFALTLLAGASSATLADEGFTLTAQGSQFYVDSATGLSATTSTYNQDVSVTTSDWISGPSYRTVDTGRARQVFEETYAVHDAYFYDNAQVSASYSPTSFSSQYTYATFDATFSVEAGSSMSGWSGVAINLSGVYQPLASPIPGTELLPSTPLFYYSLDNGAHYQSLYASTSADSGSHTFNTSGTLSFDMSSVSSQSFRILAVGGAGLSFSSLSLSRGGFASTTERTLLSSTLYAEQIYAPVPEPASYALFFAGVVALGAMRRRHT